MKRHRAQQKTLRRIPPADEIAAAVEHATAAGGPPRYLRTPAAAAFIGAEAQTLEHWRCSGTGPPFVRLSPKLIVYDRADLIAWCSARKLWSTSERAGGDAA